MNQKEYTEIYNFLLHEKIPKTWNTQKIEEIPQRYQIDDDKLYYNTPNKILRVIVQHEKDAILFMMHNHATSGHLGIDTTYNKISQKFYWKNMKEDVKEYVKTCDICQRRGPKKSKGLINPIKVKGMFEQIGIDFVGPLPITPNKNRYICVISDYLSKWPEAKAMKTCTAENVVKYLYEDIICRYGCPKIIISDRGSHFNNKLVEQLCDKFKIRHRMSSPYHPQTNGLVERFNKTLCEMLAKVSEQENQWDQHINEVLFAYRTRKHSTTQQTPYFLVYGKEPILPIDDNTNTTPNELHEKYRREYELINLSEIRRLTRERIEQSQDKLKKRHDEKIPYETKFKIGDKILLKDAAKEKQWSHKLSDKWKGPYYIYQVIGKGAYKLREIDSGRIIKPSFNVKHLKLYFERT